jgi:hypothetical protein
MAERHLVRCWFVAELVGRHFLKGCDRVFLPAREHRTQNIRDWRLCLLSQSGANAACISPTRRALKIEPTIALRHE